MATSRQERMQERMRGAQRHQVEDVSFGFVLPEPEQEPSLEPADDDQIAPPPAAAITRSTPNTSAKRRPLRQKGKAVEERAGPSPPRLQGPTPTVQPVLELELELAPRTLQSPSAAAEDVYNLPNTSTEDAEEPQETSEESIQKPSTGRAKASPIRRDGSEEQPAGTAKKTTSVKAPAARRSSRRSTIPPPSFLEPPSKPGQLAEEVTESPADAPGSGKRRVLITSDVESSSALLQRAIRGGPAMGEVTTSSPLTRKSVTTGARNNAPNRPGTRRRKMVRPQGSEEDDNLDELSPQYERPGPAPRPSMATESVPDVPSALAASSKRRGIPAEQDTILSEEELLQDAEHAEEIDEQDAARLLGRKRPRRSMGAPAESPDQDNEPEREVPAKRRRRRAAESPAKQQQPRPKKAKPKSSRKPSEKGDEQEGGHIEVTVQRFSKARAGEDHQDDVGEIPFATRGGINIVDFLAQMCEEVIAGYLQRLDDQINASEDAAGRREFKTMARALDAYRAELRTRLLEHTIAVDSLHSLCKRVRVVQKEKHGLRDEILRIRAEQEQVALRMDAVRIKHETASQQALNHIDVSSAMHDIDLVVEKGETEPQLSAAELKEAKLENLDVLISKISEQACSTSAGGGALRQIKDFNALLERAATALESR